MAFASAASAFVASAALLLRLIQLNLLLYSRRSLHLLQLRLLVVVASSAAAAALVPLSALWLHRLLLLLWFGSAASACTVVCCIWLAASAAVVASAAAAAIALVQLHLLCFVILLLHRYGVGFRCICFGCIDLCCSYSLFAASAFVVCASCCCCYCV
jgi:hypothetical protein